MMSLTTHLYLVAPDALMEVLGSGDTELKSQAGAELGRTSLPSDVTEQVRQVMEELVDHGPGGPHLDIVRTLALVSLVRALGEQVEIDTLEAVPSLQSVLRGMGDVIDYNLDAHLFGNPPPPFKAIDTAGTPLDVGCLDLDEIEELMDVLEGLDLNDDDLEEFSEEHSMELVEELVEPFMEALDEALRSRREIVFVTEG